MLNRNQYTQAVRKAKVSFFKQKFASGSTNFKKFWDTVKSMENKSTSYQLPTALRLGNTVTTDKSTIIENFNKHFWGLQLSQVRSPRVWGGAIELSKAC